MPPTAGIKYWFGLDVVGDGTFWAVNNITSSVSSKPHVYRFDLATGAVGASFNTGTPVIDVVVSPGAKTALHSTFAPGDVFVSTEDNGTVQWWTSDGTLNSVLVGVARGSVERLGFGVGGYHFAGVWWGAALSATGNTIEKFSSNGASQG